MKLLSLAWGALWVTHVAAFLTPRPITARRSASVSVSSATGLIPPSPDELKAKAAAIREEIKELEANASVTNRPNSDLVKPVPVREQASDGQALTNIIPISVSCLWSPLALFHSVYARTFVWVLPAD